MITCQLNDPHSSAINSVNVPLPSALVQETSQDQGIKALDAYKHYYYKHKGGTDDNYLIGKEGFLKFDSEGGKKVAFREAADTHQGALSRYTINCRISRSDRRSHYGNL